MAELVSYALTTLADVKESLGIDAGDTSQDNLIKRKINYATAVIENFCNLSIGHHFKETTYTDELYTGTGTNQLSLLMRPITSFTSLSFSNNPENISSFNAADSEDYFIDENSGLLNLNFSNNRWWDSFKVTYTAGYATIPADLAEACVSLASYFVENSASGTAVKRKREGQREIEYFQPSSSGSNGTNSVIDQLGLDEILSRYINYTLVDR